MKSFVLAVIATAMLTGCLKTRNEVRATAQRSEMQQQVVTMQRTNADVSTRIADYESSIRELNGRIDILENKIAQGSNSADSSVKGVEQRNAELSGTVSTLKEALEMMEKQVFALSAEVNALRAEKSSQERVAQASAETAAKKAKMNPHEVAEEYFNKKEWKKAILSYQKYRDENPKGPKFADATYKIGVCFQELGLKDEAKTFYDEVTKKFPNTDEARRGKIRLKGL